ncbi:hypothetical protein HPC49_04725 [Pyxidicoccus fallax]|uniref:HEAT repeat domain-containing protein n=1 Tax=Pyxidicoccus fallax TaxID=394095 RepID=A0A848LEJ3_9BACT|nr:hypothetical protein [Pyxidicoccus fallax]NMO16814.1 hypothetical protein [Pyxidicoccus fallax]NPC77555.1 hypothetical protein [Pyxidicoccus fallax]
MRAIAVMLLGCGMLGASEAHASEPAPAHAAAPAGEQLPALAEAEALIRQAGFEGNTGSLLSDIRDPDEREVPAADVERVLRALLSRCLAGTEDCKELETYSREAGKDLLRVQDSANALILMLGRYGSADLLPLLWQLDARGSFYAGRAMETLRTRRMAAVIASRPCAPPSAEEVATELATLGDFAALRVRDGKLVAVRPTRRELEDLAYFLAAVREAGPPVGETVEPGGDWRKPAPANATLDAAHEELKAARLRGDLQGMDTAAHRYLTLLGYPGPLKASEENAYGWHGSRFSAVMREWANVREDLGAFAEAAALYRRVTPSDGACGTGADLVWEEQLRGVIRATELHAGCRGVVVERLLDLDGKYRVDDDPAPYGLARLRAAGFDVKRLYRGALVTRHRDLPPEELKQVLSSAREPLRTAALRRLQERGPEAWEKRVLALEGFADVAQREALEPLLAMTADSVGETQHRAVTAFSLLAERPRHDPCAEDSGGFSHGGTSWTRNIHGLGERCATTLKPKERDAVVKRLLPLLDSTDGKTREVTAEALGRLGSPLAVPRLKQLVTDAYTDGHYLSGDGTRDRPRYPVREAAAKALKRFE